MCVHASTDHKLSVPLQLQHVRRALLDHEQLLLPQHLLLGQELQLGGVLQRAAGAVHPRPHGAAALHDVTSCGAAQKERNWFMRVCNCAMLH